MAITNLCSFHQQRLLQNATALHPNHYTQLSNQQGVNTQLLPPREAADENALPHFPAFWHHDKVSRQSIANLAITNNMPARSIHGKSRMVWKPGHGTIEKVDRITGEIMHLVEEFIDKSGKVSPSPI